MVIGWERVENSGSIMGGGQYKKGVKVATHSRHQFLASAPSL